MLIGLLVYVVVVVVVVANDVINAKNVMDF